ncbi:hypothetical protein CVT24_000915 [Panaeolus cyanescens]|uniref:Uncharacterized protein n=1 Tax=Panaeolus cyanescens TaxID=181874 RepID=A0A409WBL2_9AGAR|nr:hypothetical protein CVT24_000915 [Panaeolus cyanescens]
MSAIAVLSISTFIGHGHACYDPRSWHENVTLHEPSAIPTPHNQFTTKEEQRNDDIPASVKHSGNDHPPSSSPFKSRILASSTQRKRTVSSSSTYHIELFMKMGEIVSEGVGVGLVGVMSAVVGGVGEVAGVRRGVGGKGKEMEKTREVGNGKGKDRKALVGEREKEDVWDEKVKGRARAMDVNKGRKAGNPENQQVQSDLSSPHSSPPSKLR